MLSQDERGRARDAGERRTHEEMDKKAAIDEEIEKELLEEQVRNVHCSCGSRGVWWRLTQFGGCF